MSSVLAKLGLFVGGTVFGSAGVAVLSSKDAKKVYTHCTAAVLRGKDSIVKTANTLKENCADIAADAQDINEARYAKQAELELAQAQALVEASKED